MCDIAKWENNTERHPSEIAVTLFHSFTLISIDCFVVETRRTNLHFSLYLSPVISFSDTDLVRQQETGIND